VANESGSSRVLARLRLEKLDSGIFGGEFPESAIHISANADCFDLMNASALLCAEHTRGESVRYGLPDLIHRGTHCRAFFWNGERLF